jgi:exoribonuclease R
MLSADKIVMILCPSLQQTRHNNRTAATHRIVKTMMITANMMVTAHMMVAATRTAKMM